MSMNTLIAALEKEIELDTKVRMISAGPWHTADELAFLKRIGTHWRTDQTEDGRPSVPELDRRCKLTRLDLLKRYQESMQKRDRWAGIDQFKVRKYLTSAIEVESL